MNERSMKKRVDPCVIMSLSNFTWYNGLFFSMGFWVQKQGKTSKNTSNEHNNRINGRTPYQCL